ncbi:MAG: hypothetical protein OYG31_02005 [Candidatus Kaiserbacteria bacterium]|nr:hypothetical protein [Candidatus Kaiserbacteria bacterium]
MPEEEGSGRSVIDELADDISKDIKTPVDIFFLALFVIGVLSLAATTLVGPCGNVTDYELNQDGRIADYTKGATVIVNKAIRMGDTIVLPGACGIIESVNEERLSARIHILAKAPPGYIDDLKQLASEDQEGVAAEEDETVVVGPVENITVEELLEEDEADEDVAVIGGTRGAAEASRSYRPLQAFSGALEFPVRTALFLHAGSPKDDVDIRFLYPVATQPYTNALRTFYLDSIYVLLPILALFLIFLVFIGNRFEKKREKWYEWHTLRSTYISRLMQDREKTASLRARWDEAKTAPLSEDPKKWDEALDLLEDTLDSVLTQLRFEGEDLSKKLQDLSNKDLHTIERLWNAHSLIIRVKGKTDEGDQGAPPLTLKLLKKVVDIYRESFIWLGLLPHSEKNEWE